MIYDRRAAAAATRRKSLGLNDALPFFFVYPPTKQRKGTELGEKMSDG